MSEPTIWAKAKAEIQRRGWHQGAYGDDGPVDTCRVCILGALNAAATGDPDDEGWARCGHAFERLTYEVMDLDPDAEDQDGPVGWWNDAPDRTLDDVYALLDKLDAADRGPS